MVLNEFKTQQITWDKATKQFHEKIEVNSGDTNGRKLKVQIINNSLIEDLTGVKLNLAWRTKDNSKFGLDVFKVIDATRGIFEISYTTGMLSNVGKLKASLVLIDNVDRTESNEFDIDVKPSVVNDGAIQSQNSFTALTSALVKVNEWNGRIDAVEQDYADRAETLEQTYAPRLTEVTEQLTQTETKLTTNYKRMRNDIRRVLAKKMKSFVLPSKFIGLNIPFAIYTDGFNFEIDFNIEDYKLVGGKTIYVNTETGIDTNTGLTAEQAVKTVVRAYALSLDNDTIYIDSPIGKVMSIDSWGNRYWRKNINVISKNKLSIYGGRSAGYTKVDGYVNLYSTPQPSVGKILDFNFEEPLEYKRVYTLEECDATSGSYFFESGTAYVHTTKNIEPSDKIAVLLTNQIGIIDIPNTSNNTKMFVENIDFYGASGLVVKNDATYTDVQFFAKNCSFNHSIGNTNGVNADGAKTIFVGCSASNNQRDGFNYHSKNGITSRFLEIDCIGAINGNNSNPSPNTFNGSTSHDGAKGIRIRGYYYGNIGGNVVDVKALGNDATQTVNLGCTAFDSLSELEAHNVDFAIQDGGAEMWLYGCVSFGSKWSINVNSLSTVYVDKFSEYDMTTGNGAIANV